MKTLLYNNEKIALIAIDNNDYFNYWANKANNVYLDSSLSYYEKIQELKRCIDNMKFWKNK